MAIIIASFSGCEKWCLELKNNVDLLVAAYRAGGWKRAEPAPLAITKPSANQQPVGTTGRTDWASK